MGSGEASRGLRAAQNNSAPPTTPPPPSCLTRSSTRRGSIQYLQKRRWKLPESAPGGEEGRAGRAAEGVHQRVEEAARQGGGGAEEAEGKAGQEEGDPC